MTTHFKSLLTTGALLGAFMLAPAVAHADLPTQDPHGSAALLLGYGFKDGSNFGVAGRGGYTFEQGFYVGGLLQYHVGKDNYNLWYLGVEGGYDFIIDPIVVRPYIGLGPAFAHASEVCGLGRCVGGGSNTYFDFWFGGTVLYPINDQWFVGGDLRFPIIDGYVFPTLSATGGLNF